MSVIEQIPTYLPEVEANPRPSPYADLINVTKAAGRECWQIWNLFAFRPEVTSHLASFTEGVMRSPAPISGALRELIAAYTSWTNDCQFCWHSHAASCARCSAWPRGSVRSSPPSGRVQPATFPPQAPVL